MFLNLNKIFDENFIIYAHTTKDNKNETLEEHILLCEKYFHKINDDKNIEKIIKKFCEAEFPQNESAKKILKEMAIQILVFHDLGKCNPLFQKEVMKNKNFKVEKYEGVSGTKHSFLSSIFYLDYYFSIIENQIELDKDEKRRLFLFALEHSFVIARHHSDFQSFSDYMNEFVSDETEKLLKFLNAQKIDVYKGPKTLCLGQIKKLKNYYPKMKKKNQNEKNTMEYFYYRFLYSVLVSCDYYATTEVCNRVVKKQFGSLKQKKMYQKAYQESEIVKSIRTFQKNDYAFVKDNLESANEINMLRNCMFLEAEDELSNSKQDIYFLEAPTGGGKSNIAFNLTFQLMKEKNKLFYIYPFNTLVEQNRENLIKLFPDKELSKQIVVVNSITPMKSMEKGEDNTTKYYQETLLDRQFLNYPITLSTHVSFFRLLFGCAREDLFAFLQLTDSVIVLDEIQSYKNTIWAEIIIMLHNCAKLMGMKIIIMSATLPNLEILGGTNCTVQYLIPDSKKYFEHHLFRDRVKISYQLLDDMDFDLELLLKHIEQYCGVEKTILVEFISKKTAETFYHMLCETDTITVPIYCLTGDHSIYEREKILKPIRKGIQKECILVATQVVEAGVDIDMDIGYKDISKLDSEEQFLGRINRSFHKEGLVYFFHFDKAEQIYHNDYRINQSLTLVNHEMRKILERKDFSFYYQKVLQLIKQEKNQSTDETGLEAFDELIAILDYPAIEKRMELISDNEWNMNIFLSRKIEIEDGQVLDGKQVWDQYKTLLMADMDYAEKQVKLSEVKSNLNLFIYSVKKNPNIGYDDIIGEIIFIANGEKYFEHGMLNRELLNQDDIFFGD